MRASSGDKRWQLCEVPGSGTRLAAHVTCHGNNPDRWDLRLRLWNRSPTWILYVTGWNVPDGQNDDMG